MNINFNCYENRQNFGKRILPEIGPINAAHCYRRAVVRTQRLAPEVETEVIRQAKSGDLKAKNRLFESYLSLVVKLTKPFSKFGVEMADLISEGNIALMKALRGFDVNKGYKFSTYAGFHIRRAVVTAIKKQTKDTYYSGAHMNELRSATRKLTQKLSGEPTEEQLAQEMQISLDELRALKELSTRNKVSLSSAVGENSDGELIDFIADETSSSPLQATEQRALASTVQRFMSILSLNEQLIIKKRYGIDGEEEHTLEKAGVAIGVTRQRAMQIEKRALEKLTHPKRLKVLRDYAEC